MNEIERIDDLLGRMLEGGGWHGPGLLQVLDGIDAAQASARPLEGAHSIRELVLHVIAWHEIARERLDGRWIELTEERDWPPVADASEEAWRRDVERLRETIAATRAAVRGMAADDVDRPLPGAGGDAPRALTLHGLIHHDAWHGGQIALLRRALGAAPAE